MNGKTEHTTTDGEAWWLDDDGVWRDENGLAVLPKELVAEGLAEEGSK